MKILNVGLVGYGKMGKIYIKEINNNKNFKIIKILNHRNIQNKSHLIKKFFNLKKIDLFIISSPIKTHFEYLVHAFKANKNIIVEKPLVENFNQLKKLTKLNKKYKKKIMIHHNDVLNLEKFNLGKMIGGNKNIKKIEMIYGKNEITNRYKEPYIDWLPHPLAIIINFFGNPNKFKIINYSKKIKKNLVKENLKIIFNLDKFKIFINFSNDFNKPHKKVIIYKKGGNILYDGYKKKNQKSIKLLLKKFQKTKKINDVSSNINVYELLFKIKKVLKKKSNL